MQSTSINEAIYYYSENGHARGPYSLTDLLEKIEPDTFVYRQGIDWTMARDVEELKSPLQERYPELEKEITTENGISINGSPGHLQDNPLRRKRVLVILASLAIFLVYGAVWYYAFYLIGQECKSGIHDSGARQRLQSITWMLPSVGPIKTFKLAQELYNGDFQMLGTDYIILKITGEGHQIIKASNPKECSLHFHSLVRVGNGKWVIHDNNKRCCIWEPDSGICPEPMYSKCILKDSGTIELVN